MHQFHKFIDKKSRKAVRELHTIKKVLEQAHMKVEDFTQKEDPYIFLHSPDTNLSFDGVRIYKIGESLAWRVQREADTHPYGSAYKLDIQEMWNDLLSDEMDEEKAGRAIMKTIVEEMKKFFKESGQAEKDLRSSEIDKKYGDALGRVVIKSTGTDYSNMLTSKN